MLCFFARSIISFVVVAFVLFLIVKAWNRMRRDDPSAGPTDNELLIQIRDLLAARQQNP